MVHVITREQLQQLVGAHFGSDRLDGDRLDGDRLTLVEALPAAHYAAGHLPGALDVEDVLSAELAAELAPDPHGTVVVHCSGPACGRSKTTAAAFERYGYTDVRVYPGGKADWHAAGLPLAVPTLAS